jgi:hypothetical protein
MAWITERLRTTNQMHQEKALVPGDGDDLRPIHLETERARSHRDGSRNRRVTFGPEFGLNAPGR